jgi:hypothetical protein
MQKDCPTMQDLGPNVSLASTLEKINGLFHSDMDVLKPATARTRECYHLPDLGTRLGIVSRMSGARAPIKVT